MKTHQKMHLNMIVLKRFPTGRLSEVPVLICIDSLWMLVHSESVAVTLALSVCPQSSPVTVKDVSVAADVELAPPSTWECRV